MAGTSVESVSNAASMLMQNIGNMASQTAGTQNFSDVLGTKTQEVSQPAKQSDHRTRQTDDLTRSEASDETQDTLQTKEPDRAEGIDSVDANEPSSTVDGKDVEELDEDALTKAQEVMVSAALQIVQQITETFAIDADALSELMADAGMELNDLMNPAQLSDLLLELGGAEDSLQLLTDESLYADVQDVMQLQSELIAQVAEELSVEPEALGGILEQLEKLTAQNGTADVQPKMDPSAEPLQDTESTGDDAVGIHASDNDAVSADEVMAQRARESSERGNAEAEEHSASGQSTASSNSQVNTFLQNLRSESFEANLAETQNVSSSWNEQTQNIMNQIMDYMKVNLTNESSELTMQLHPQSLGNLHVQVASKNGVVTANFTAENEMVRAAIETQMVQLKESFAEQGIRVEAIEVTVEPHAFEENLEQGQNGGSADDEKATLQRRTRRINLNALDGEEELDEEDQLTAEMMAANGNTVDFTA